MTVVGVLRAILRRWWLPILIALVAVVAVYAITPNAKAAQIVYSAKTILVENPSLSQTQNVNLAEAALEVTVGQAPTVAAGAIHYKGNPANLAAEVSTSVDSTVGTLTITATNLNGAEAASVVTAFANALNTVLLQQATAQYQSQVASVEARLNTLQAEINQYQGAGTSNAVAQAKLGGAEDQYRLAYDQFQQLAAQGPPIVPFSVLEKATPVPTGGYHPPRSRLERSVIGGGVGLLIGLILSVLIDMAWPRINDREEAEREFGTVVLAEVPKLSRRDRQRTNKHQEVGRKLASFREAYRMLRTSILLIGSAEAHDDAGHDGRDLLVSGPQVILVTSPLPREGKSTTVAALAASMAETGRRVLVCNADFRAPQVHRAFDLKPGPGLTDLLTGREGTRKLADLVHQTGVPGVSLVHSGSEVSDAAELIARQGAEILNEARSLADVVLLDTAPLLVVSDASELLPAVDAVVMVSRAGQTSRDSARRSYELLARAGIPVLGVVLVGASSPTSYYYGGHYGSPVGSRWRLWLDRRRRQRGIVSVGSLAPERPVQRRSAPRPAASGDPDVRPSRTSDTRPENAGVRQPSGPEAPTPSVTASPTHLVPTGPASSDPTGPNPLPSEGRVAVAPHFPNEAGQYSNGREPRPSADDPEVRAPAAGFPQRPVEP